MLIEAQSRMIVINLDYVVMMQVFTEDSENDAIVVAEDTQGRKYRLGYYDRTARAIQIIEDILNSVGDKSYRMPDV